MTPQDVLGQMLAAGLDQPPLPLDTGGRIVRFGPRKRQWYCLREQRTAGGSYVTTGSFGDWRGGTWRVDVDWRGIGDDERAALQAQREQQQAAAQQARDAESARAAMSAAQLWASAARTGASEYLVRKQVVGEACRYLPDGSIVVPLLRYDAPREDALRALQRIWPDGRKRFTAGFQKPGVCCRLGLAEVGMPMLLCEGYATGLTLRLAVRRRMPVVVALDAGNLRPVAELMRALYPASRILICADDDWRTRGNPGRTAAHKTARAVPDAAYTWPYFRPGHRGPKDTDFNDLHVREGLEAVRRQIAHVLPLIGCSDLFNEAA